MSRTADAFIALHPELLERDRTSPRAVRIVSALATPLAAWHRFRVDGLERIPPGPCVLVANHSSGAPSEIFMLLRAWRARFGDRPVRGLAHRIAFEGPLALFPIVQKIGGIFAHPAVARAALGRGHALLVFPGGDVDACRSFFERYRVKFDGRAGFARIAREAGVPLVPIAICGAHAGYFLLPGGPRLARLLRIDRVGFKSFPLSLGIVGAIAALVATILEPTLWPLAALAFVQAVVPLPTRIEARALEPVVARESESDAELAERVRGAIETTVAEMAATRWTPWG